ncbi:MAG: hypothetical protein K2P92_08660 [Bdellovibrionaceae bacterium]|nr:hypothetical protein [Pseudobdellovibrionaceae bacterium]
MAAACSVLVACVQRSEKLYEEAYQEIEKGHFRIATDLLIRSSDVEENNLTKYKYLSEAARIVRFEIQDYPRALKMFRKIILEADDSTQRISAQEAIAEIELENTQDYQQALKELQKLEPLVSDTKKKEKIKLRIAQTLYLTGQYEQAIDEINVAQKFITNYESNFLKLKAEVFLAEKKYKESLATYEELRLKDPIFFKDENLYIATSIAYEENEQFADALAFLNKNETQIKDKSYLELRVKRLKERLVNKPLFKGIRK